MTRSQRAKDMLEVIDEVMCDTIRLSTDYQCEIKNAEKDVKRLGVGRNDAETIADQVRQRACRPGTICPQQACLRQMESDEVFFVVLDRHSSVQSSRRMISHVAKLVLAT